MTLKGVKRVEVFNECKEDSPVEEDSGHALEEILEGNHVAQMDIIDDVDCNIDDDGTDDVGVRKAGVIRDVQCCIDVELPICALNLELLPSALRPTKHFRYPICVPWEAAPDFGESCVVVISYGKGWRGIYIKWHNNMAGAANSVVQYVEQCMISDSLEIKDYLKAVGDLSASQVGFRDVEMFLFKSNVNVLLNLVGLHYSISWLGVPAEEVLEALENRKISQRQVCVKWWKLGRWFYGFRMRDEYHSRWVSLQDLAAAEDNEVLGVLNRGAIYEIFHIQISVSNPTASSWAHQSTQV